MEHQFMRVPLRLGVCLLAVLVSAGWERPLWFTRLHRILKLGGIIAELRRE